MAVTCYTTVTVDFVGNGWITTPPEGLTSPYVNTDSPAIFMPYQVLTGTTAILLPLTAGNTNFFMLDGNDLSAGLQLTIKGAVSDVGVPISSSFPSLIPTANSRPNLNPAGPPTLPIQQFYLTSQANGTVNIGWV